MNSLTSYSYSFLLRFTADLSQTLIRASIDSKRQKPANGSSLRYQVEINCACGRKLYVFTWVTSGTLCFSRMLTHTSTAPKTQLRTASSILNEGTRIVIFATIICLAAWKSIWGNISLHSLRFFIRCWMVALFHWLVFENSPYSTILKPMREDYTCKKALAHNGI